MIKSCVIGWPVSHSRSPLIHSYWLKQFGIDGSYTRQPVAPSALSAFIEGLSDAGYAGCNVTLPHKEEVYPLIVPADASTEKLAAVNTVYLQEGRIYGTNTDGEGFINNLMSSQPGLLLKNSRTVVLGAGGASIAIINALLEQGVAEVAIANRTLGKAHLLRARFGSRVVPVVWETAANQLSECSLLVNTTSLGMKGQPDLMLDLSHLQSGAVVTDIVYTPLRTTLLRRATQHGYGIVEGLGMLLHQAVRGFSLWYGKTPRVTRELYDIVANDIDPAHTA